MIDTVYIEEEIQNHPRVRTLLDQFPNARRIFCARYGEVFNPKAQNFRLQKQNPALILAKKYGRLILDVPAGCGIGKSRNFYFSHMLNCVYDCRYCFLQGMYRSAHYVWFVNYEDFQAAIERTVEEGNETESYFFPGYDCDSLAFESMTGFVQSFLPFFAKYPKAWVELRTKSAQVSPLLRLEPIPNAVVAFSFTPSEVSEKLEHKVPSVAERLRAMEKLQECGWKLGLRFDPLIYHEDYEGHYETLFRSVFGKIRASSLHSVSIGAFRLPKPIYETMYRLYPDEKLFAGALEERGNLISYPKEIEGKMIDFITRQLLEYVPEQILFPCSA